MAKKRPLTTQLAKRSSKKTSAPTSLLGDLRKLIEAAKEQTARAVNSTLVTMYWEIGKRIREDVLQNERAEYGKEIVQTLSAQLTAEFGRGFTEKGLWRMVQLAEAFPDIEIVAALSRQSSFVVAFRTAETQKQRPRSHVNRSGFSTSKNSWEFPF